MKEYQKLIEAYWGNEDNNNTSSPVWNLPSIYEKIMQEQLKNWEIDT